MECSWRVHCCPDGHWDRLFLTVVARNKQNEIVPPRTKKNSPIPVTLPNGRRIVLPSANFKKWEKAATGSMALCLLQMGQKGLMRITDYVNVEAKIYRDRNVGDHNGFTQAIGDWLESSGILANDRLIESWDGTVRLKDAEFPRLELCLTYLWPGGKQTKARPSRPLVEPALPVLTGMSLFDSGGDE